MAPSTSSTHWTHEQLKLAFHFYCQTPFGQFHSKNKKLIELAELIGRTPGALAMKCVNFASLDPSILRSGRKGLSNASQKDREIWDEFHADWDKLAGECEGILQHLREEHGVPAPAIEHISDEVLDDTDYTGETRKAIIERRHKQDFFRKAVLSSYHGRCCISGVSEQRLLVASHIVPWSKDKSNRLNPRNGLCLSALHDKAFDAYLFTLTDDFQVTLSPSLQKTSDEFLKEVFWKIDGKSIELPERFEPDRKFLALHRSTTLSEKPDWKAK
jgi:hypothetical protein